MYRYGVWAPPHGVWHTMISFLPCKVKDRLQNWEASFLWENVQTISTVGDARRYWILCNTFPELIVSSTEYSHQYFIEHAAGSAKKAKQYKKECKRRSRRQFSPPTITDFSYYSKVKPNIPRAYQALLLARWLGDDRDRDKNITTIINEIPRLKVHRIRLYVLCQLQSHIMISRIRREMGMETHVKLWC